MRLLIKRGLPCVELCTVASVALSIIVDEAPASSSLCKKYRDIALLVQSDHIFQQETNEI